MTPFPDVTGGLLAPVRSYGPRIDRVFSTARGRRKLLQYTRPGSDTFSFTAGSRPPANCEAAGVVE